MLLKDPWSNSQAINGIINALIDKKSETYEKNSLNFSKDL